jgi:hypothetical protein
MTASSLGFDTSGLKFSIDPAADHECDGYARVLLNPLQSLNLIGAEVRPKTDHASRRLLRHVRLYGQEYW